MIWIEMEDTKEYNVEKGGEDVTSYICIFTLSGSLVSKDFVVQY